MTDDERKILTDLLDKVDEAEKLTHSHKTPTDAEIKDFRKLIVGIKGKAKLQYVALRIELVQNERRLTPYEVCIWSICADLSALGEDIKPSDMEAAFRLERVQDTLLHTLGLERPKREGLYLLGHMPPEGQR